MKHPLLAAGMFAAMAIAGCEESFSPIAPSELQFSVFGHLDASADTQWIRVTPLRPVSVTSPGPLGASVTLQHLGTGRVVQLRDSVFSFSKHNDDIGSEGVYLHNFWTTERIQPGATYRVSVRGEGERASEAVVEIPPDYDVEVWLGAVQGDFLRVAGLEHVAFAVSNTYFLPGCEPALDRTPFTEHLRESDVLMIPIHRRFRFTSGGCGESGVAKRELLVVGSGAPWPSGREYATGALGIPDIPSNVSNAVGFLGGVLTKVLPYEQCHIESFGPSREHCRLRYDARSATLSGTVMDERCGGGVSGADIRLREINPGPPAGRKIRQATTSKTGTFQIGGLEPGSSYELSVRRLSAQGFDQFEEYGATLTFSVGQHVTHDVGLRRVDPCASQS